LPRAPDESYNGLAPRPRRFNVIIEIPMNADPIKYESTKTGALFVASGHRCTTRATTATSERWPTTAIRSTLVMTPVPQSGRRRACRPLGMLKMSDEAGGDNKLLAVPIDRILSIYTQWQKPDDLNPLRLKTIQHFFEHYKDLEPGKWVKVLGWEGPQSARDEVASGIAAWKKVHAA
jgi:inorganic pyrophosphatase